MSDQISFYPPSPSPGSSAFGEFEFGVSPFGDVPAFNWRSTVISQYANSPILLQLIESWSESLDQTGNFDSFYDTIWNVITAQGYGLDIWGLIVGVDRNIQVSTGINYFGFEQGVSWNNFGPGGTSPFYVGAPLTSKYTMTDLAYRQLILAKAQANICTGSIPDLNKILLYLFGPGNPFGPGGECYVTNGANMTMTFTFGFVLTPLQTSIINNSGVLPVPSGVTLTIITP